MLPISSLKSMNVLFATPCYISAVAMNYVTSIFAMTCDAMHLGLGCTLHMHSESLIPRGRNVIVRKFLAEEQFTITLRPRGIRLSECMSSVQPKPRCIASQVIAK